MSLFLRARAVNNFFLRAPSTLEKYRWRAASTSSTSSYFVCLPLVGISLLLIGNVVLRQVIVNNRAEYLQIRTIGANLERLNQSLKLRANCALLDVKSHHGSGWTLKNSKNFKSCTESCQGDLLVPKPYRFNPTLK